MTYPRPVMDYRRFPIEWALQRTVDPTFEPVTIDEVRDHGKMDPDVPGDDAYLQSLIVGAREAMEEQLSKALLTQTWVLYLTRFPCWEIRLPRPPLVSVSSVAYLDVNGAAQTVSPSLYTVDTHAQPAARIVPVYGLFWPPTRPVPNAVTITYIAGVASRGAIPQMIRQALLMLVASLYVNREADAVTALTRLPLYDGLMDTHRSQWEPEFA
jgi:uncharacterized phiE125 gp8 family phage protein